MLMISDKPAISSDRGTGEGEELFSTKQTFHYRLNVIGMRQTAFDVVCSKHLEHLCEQTHYASLRGRTARWQHDRDGDTVLPGLASVVARLDPSLHPPGVFRWFVTPDPDLELDQTPVSPRDWLRLGNDPAPVAALAEALGTGL